MPRRTSSRALAASSSTPQDSYAVLGLSANTTSPDVLELRRQWKWAAFSQFFFTFNSLFAMNTVTLTDIENDLAHSTSLVLPRVMQRMLQTLTQDRKISIDNWQTALRKQYFKRDPGANPIGPIEQLAHATIPESSRASTAPRDLSTAPSAGPRQDENFAVPKDAPSDGFESSAANNDLARDDSTHSSAKLEAAGVLAEEAEQRDEPEKSLDWLDLPMLAKLDSLHILQEWQFQNPHRLRTLMKDDDESAQWRIEPIGYDAKRNAYWLIGADRLWIQREIPRPNLKRKRNPGDQLSKGTGKKNQGKAAKAQQKKRRRVEAEPNVTSSNRTTRRTVPVDSSPTGGRSGRAAKARANQKLDAQAKDLAAFQKQMAGSRSTRAAKGGPNPSSPKKPAGIRLSARLRGTVVEDEWQEIPEEWLGEGPAAEKSNADADIDSSPTGTKTLKTGLESDVESISDLTELSEDSDSKAMEDLGDAEGDEDHEVTPQEQSDLPPDSADLEDEPHQVLPDGFIEWETICVTLEEWEGIAERFEKATHYAEKALYKTLAHGIVPIITAELREVERKRRAEDAVVHRKRSSRIAMKESEKEEERLMMKQRAEEEEKLSRARRLEARLKKEEADRQRRETAREQRRREREQKVLEESQANASPSPASEAHGPAPVLLNHPLSQHPTSSSSRTLPNGSGSGSRTPVEDWELDCEICHRRGTNQDDGTPIMCCGICSKWQHIICHDRQDYHAGRPKRNWDAEEFVCQRCRPTQSGPQSNGGPPVIPLQFSPVNQKPPPYNGVLSQPYHTNPQSSSQGYGNVYYNQAANNGRYSYEHQSSDLRTSVAPPHPSQSHGQQPHSPVTFAHYQPQQGGFSTSRPTYAAQESVRLPLQQFSHAPSPQPSQGPEMAQYTAPFQVTFHPTIPQSAHDKWSNPAAYPRNDSPYTMNGNPSAPQSYAQNPYYATHPSVAPHVQNSHLRGSGQHMGQYPSYQYNAYQHTR
ncbi:hypothetical protein BV22DRAFT_1023125 [Leucogyrophana mollusca]|uniref:Uncharacterized protein n=1 Tax=Leucogyrophana mollusca TaxID=85980 RepID=A0ACB8B0S4_9AGAM|nr:hypothetical protein BV22DRAFT_1023125 [Leucogyrophana mollusca]